MSNPGRDSSNNLTTTFSQPPSFQAQYSRASQQQPNENSHLIVRRLIITLVVLFVSISVVSCIVWLIVHPLSPIITVKSFFVSNFSLSANNSRIIKGDYDVQFSIWNPNKRVSLVMDRFDIRLLYKTKLITKAWMGDVYLDKLSQQYSSPKWFSKDSDHHPFHKKGFKDIMNDWTSKREVSFIVKMSIRTGFRPRKWLTKTSVMEVSCPNLVVQFLEANKEVGKLKGGGKDCSVRYD